MVDGRELHGYVLGRRFGKNEFEIFEMKYANFYVPKRIVTMWIYFFLQIDVVNFLLIEKTIIIFSLLKKKVIK